MLKLEQIGDLKNLKYRFEKRKNKMMSMKVI